MAAVARLMLISKALKDGASGWPSGLTIATSGEAAFRLLLRRIEHATHQIDVRAYIWRDDVTGNAVARALLDAAERGVAVRIWKDADGGHHERHEGCGQSLFHKQTSLGDHFATTVLHGFYGPRPKLSRQVPSAIAAAVVAHPGITFESALRYDHAKVFVIDSERVLLGGMCLGDDAHHELLDYLVEVEGSALVARFVARNDGALWDPERRFDFLINDRQRPGRLRTQRLGLIESALSHLRVQMAFFGDPAFTDALVAAVKRGVRVTILSSRQAGKLRWYNPRVFNEIRRRVGTKARLRIALHERVVHAKLMIVDDRVVDVGSANFTTLSHEGYAEANLYINDPAVARVMAAHFDQLVAHAALAPKRIRASRLRARLEFHFMQRAGLRALGVLPRKRRRRARVRWRAHRARPRLRLNRNRSAAEGEN